MDPQDYFDEFVRPNFEDFRADRANRRLAVNAAISASHMADCVEKRQARSAVRDTVAQKCPEFNVVADVADAYKHTIISAKRSGRARDFTDFVKVEPYRASPFADGSYFSDGAGWSDGPLIITVSKDDGGRLDLFSVLNKVVDYWQNYLATGRL